MKLNYFQALKHYKTAIYFLLESYLNHIKTGEGKHGPYNYIASSFEFLCAQLLSQICCHAIQKHKDSTWCDILRPCKVRKQ